MDFQGGSAALYLHRGRRIAARVSASPFPWLALPSLPLTADSLFLPLALSRVSVPLPTARFPNWLDQMPPTECGVSREPTGK